MASIKLKSGATMANGMIAVPGFRANTMEKDSLLHPRRGAPKRQAAPAVAHGMRDVSATGHALAFVGGKRPLDDEPLEKNWQGKGNVPTHPGMFSHPRSNAGDALRGNHDPEAANAVLREGGNLGNVKR